MVVKWFVYWNVDCDANKMSNSISCFVLIFTLTSDVMKIIKLLLSHIDSNLKSLSEHTQLSKQIIDGANSNVEMKICECVCHHKR